jgi:hypothetical protein
MKSNVFNPKTGIIFFANINKADDNPEKRKDIINKNSISTQELVNKAKVALSKK